MWVFSCVLLSHLLEFLLSQNIYLQSCPDSHTVLPPNHSGQLYWLTPHYFDFSPPHSSLYNLCIGTTGSLLDSWPLTMGPISCPETSFWNYCYLLCNNPEEDISHPLHSVSLISALEIVPHVIRVFHKIIIQIHIWFWSSSFMSMNTALIFLQDKFHFFLWCEEVVLWNTLPTCSNNNGDNCFFSCITNDNFLMCLVTV